MKIKSCSEEGCSKTGIYKHKGRKKKYCGFHMKPLMYIKHSKKCNHFGCKSEKISNYHYNYYNKPILCVEHKLDGMICLDKIK